MLSLLSSRQTEVESEMFSKRLGEGLGTAYCAFGLRKVQCVLVHRIPMGKRGSILKTRSGS